jgi:3D (Asp-Asp-Asp) domain-containing protein
MKELVRGAAMFALLATLVVFVYAQGPKQDDALIMTTDSQSLIENTIDNNLVSTNAADTADDDDSKSLVKKTVMSSAAGASKGAFSASAYCFSGRTAMGHSVRRGLIAADPRVLKLGSKVYINAGQWSGTYLVSDTGGAIKGKRIDIWVPGCAEARKFGRRSVQIYAAQ